MSSVSSVIRMFKNAYGISPLGDPSPTGEFINQGLLIVCTTLGKGRTVG
jgi:hypothetical protein